MAPGPSETSVSYGAWILRINACVHDTRCVLTAICSICGLVCRYRVRSSPGQARIQEIEAVRRRALDHAVPKAIEILHAVRKNTQQVSRGTKAQPLRQADP